MHMLTGSYSWQVTRARSSLYQSSCPFSSVKCAGIFSLVSKCIVANDTVLIILWQSHHTIVVPWSLFCFSGSQCSMLRNNYGILLHCYKYKKQDKGIDVHLSGFFYQSEDVGERVDSLFAAKILYLQWQGIMNPSTQISLRTFIYTTTSFHFADDAIVAEECFSNNSHPVYQRCVVLLLRNIFH